MSNKDKINNRAFRKNTTNAGTYGITGKNHSNSVKVK